MPVLLYSTYTERYADLFIVIYTGPRVKKDFILKSKVHLHIDSLFAINGYLKWNNGDFTFSILKVLAYEQILT